MQQEQQPQHRQTISVVKGNPFITTELWRTDINGTEFCTFSETVPYNGSVDELRAETEALKQAELDRHNQIISDADNKLAELDKIDSVSS